MPTETTSRSAAPEGAPERPTPDGTALVGRAARREWVVWRPAARERLERRLLRWWWRGWVAYCRSFRPW